MADGSLGAARLSPSRPVVAGSFCAFTLTYTAGRVGIDDQGRLTVAFRDVCDAAKLQWTIRRRRTTSRSRRPRARG